METNDPANSSPPEPSLPAVDTHTHQSRPNWRVGIGVRGGWAAGTCSPPKKILLKTRKKMKIARNCENSHLPRSFRKWGWGGDRVSSSCRPLSGKSAFVGNESRFCRSKRPRVQSFTAEFSDMGWVGDVASSVGCRASLHLSGMIHSCWRASELITARLIHCYELLHFAVVH